jgi:hypothetical protein
MALHPDNAPEWSSAPMQATLLALGGGVADNEA